MRHPHRPKLRQLALRASGYPFIPKFRAVAERAYSQEVDGTVVGGPDRNVARGHFAARASVRRADRNIPLRQPAAGIVDSQDQPIIPPRIIQRLGKDPLLTRRDLAHESLDGNAAVLLRVYDRVLAGIDPCP